MDETSQAPAAPDLIDQALTKDAETIAGKAIRGEPLTARERQILEATAARLKSEAEPAFTLEGAGGGLPGLVGLTQKEIAAAWGYSVRNIKNWVADGRKAKDPPPFSDPAQMPGWFERVFTGRKCPDKLRMAAQRLLVSAEAAAAPPEAPAAHVDRSPIAEGEKGLLAMLGRLRDSEVSLHAKYMDAVSRGEETRASFLFSEWSKAVEKLRALEKSAPKALEELGIYVRKDDLQREIVQLHTGLLRSFRQAIRGGRARLRATSTALEWDAVASDIVDEMAAILADTSFAEPLELESEVAA